MDSACADFGIDNPDCTTRFPLDSRGKCVRPAVAKNPDRGFLPEEPDGRFSRTFVRCRCEVGKERVGEELVQVETLRTIADDLQARPPPDVVRGVIAAAIMIGRIAVASPSIVTCFAASLTLPQEIPSRSRAPLKLPSHSGAVVM